MKQEVIDESIWQYQLFKVGEFSLQLDQLLTSMLIIAITLIVSMLMRRSLHRLSTKANILTAAQAYIISRITHYLIIVIGLVLAISALGIEMGKLALIASALGVGIGLGLQGIVNNFVSGIAILLEKTLKVGDFIELDAEIVGEVIEIHMRATLIRTNDNVDVLIPNAEITNGRLINWTLEDNIRRFRIPFNVAYGTDKDLVKKAALEAAANVPYTLNTEGRRSIVWMTSFGDSSLNFMLGVWVPPEQVKRPTALMSDYLWALDDAFKKYQIQIPFPQRDLHIKSRTENVGSIEQ